MHEEPIRLIQQRRRLDFALHQSDSGLDLPEQEMPRHSPDRYDRQGCGWWKRRSCRFAQPYGVTIMSKLPDTQLILLVSPSTRLVYPVSWVLPLTTKGRVPEKLQWQLASTPDELNLFELDALTGFDKPARIVSTEILRGVKGLHKQMQFAPATSAQLFDFFRPNAIGDTFQTIDDVKWHYDQTAGASVLTISGTVTFDWSDDGTGGKSLALPGGGFSPPERRVRASDQNRDAPFYTKPDYICFVTTVRVPTTTETKQWSAKNSFDTRMFGRAYHRTWRYETERSAWSARRAANSLRLITPQRSPTTRVSPPSITAWAGYPMTPMERRHRSAWARQCQRPMTLIGLRPTLLAEALESPIKVSPMKRHLKGVLYQAPAGGINLQHLTATMTHVWTALRWQA